MKGNLKDYHKELWPKNLIFHATYKNYELVGEKNGREPSIDMIRKIFKF